MIPGMAVMLLLGAFYGSNMLDFTDRRCDSCSRRGRLVLSGKMFLEKIRESLHRSLGRYWEAAATTVLVNTIALLARLVCFQR
jgi:hypothetical protein